MYTIKVSSHTDKGDIKAINQDGILSRQGIINGHMVGLFVVADGCGGLAFGEQISHLIIADFARIWEDELPHILCAKKPDLHQVDRFLNRTLDDLNQKARAFGKQTASKVGSTVSLLLSIDKRYMVKNVGDSRVYRKRGNELLQITQDQSLVADLVRNGELTNEQAKHYKKKNVLTMCIGAFDALKVYSQSGIVHNKDIFVLCCDGLYNHMDADTMLYVLRDKHTALEYKAHQLRRCIEVGKAHDNVSCIVCQYTKQWKIRFW